MRGKKTLSSENNQYGMISGNKAKHNMRDPQVSGLRQCASGL
jgi:hypothetical protein